MQTVKKGSRKKMKNPNRSRIIALACCCVLLVSAFIGGGLAKYTKQVQVSGTGEPFTAALFDRESDGYFKLEESKNHMGDDGAYDTFESGAVTANEYIMIPGTENLKYPYVSYTNKTSIPAYLYLVVEGDDAATGEFEYDIPAFWTKISSESGKPGTYVYSEKGVPIVLTNDDTYVNAAAITLLKNNANGDTAVYITALQKLLNNKTLAFTAYAVQAPDAKATVADAAAVWNRKDDGGKYLVDSTAKVVNTFIPGSVAASVVENDGNGFDGVTKSKVQIKNEGNVPALVRARLVVNWVAGDENGQPVLDENGNPKIIANPQGVTDPTVGSINTGWTKIGDYYYYNGIVPAGGMTPDLIKNEITSSGTPIMQIEVIAEAIQATGYADPRNPSDTTSAVCLAWVDPQLGGHYYDAAQHLWLPDNYR